MRRQMLKKGVTVSLALLTLIQGVGEIPSAHTCAEAVCDVSSNGEFDTEDPSKLCHLSYQKHECKYALYFLL